MQTTIQRRFFLKKLGLLSLTTAGSTHWLGAVPANKQIGLQLYSLREDIKGNVSGILKQVADIGFKKLEAANYADGEIYGYSPKEIKKMREKLCTILCLKTPIPTFFAWNSMFTGRPKEAIIP